MADFKLEKLKVHNFRNLEDQILEFSTSVNCIFGNNGNGKTNLLEAIYYLTNRKSFKKNTDFTQQLSLDGDSTEITITSLFKDQGEPITVSGKLNAQTEEWFINNLPTKKKLVTPSVFVNPFDSGLFHSTAAFRRDWFDYHIGLLNPAYKKQLSAYAKLLRMRNHLLSNKPDKFLEQIKAIDIDFCRLIGEITLERQKFLIELKTYLSNNFQMLFEEKHLLEVNLDGKFANKTSENITKIVEEYLSKDCLAGMTRVGIHRDDFVLSFDGLNSFDYCSLGQQKMAFLSLLFAYIELFRYKFNSYPIVLIDDVSGELDRERWKNLIRYLDEKNFQVFITTANENFKQELEKITKAKKIVITNGKVVYEN